MDCIFPPRSGRMWETAVWGGTCIAGILAYEVGVGCRCFAGSLFTTSSGNLPSRRRIGMTRMQTIKESSPNAGCDVEKQSFS